MNSNPYKHALIGLDLTPMDEAIIDYLPTLLSALPIERIYFIHISKELELPEEILDKYPDLVAPLDETIADGINRTVSEQLKSVDREVEFEVIVQEGTPLEHLLRTARIKNIDLMVMGRKRSLEGSGILAGHVVRKSPTSMLIIPEGYRNGITNMMLPVDFSRHSRMAYELASVIQRRMDAQLQFSHIYQLPIGYYKTGKTHDEFDEIMRHHAEKDFQRFCKENHLEENPVCHFLLAEGKTVPDIIYEQAKRSSTDLILIGSRGRTGTSALLIGSIVEKLVFRDSDIPVLIVKNKGESMTFFEALLKI